MEQQIEKMEEVGKLRRQLKMANKIIYDNAKWYIPTIVIGTVTSIVINWDKIKNA